MARKFDLISELYERTCFAVTDNPVNWQSFLKTAGRNFRLRFDEQLLIYAQRPDATAVLEIERWNGTFGRWVNRGAKGIAVFEDADRSRQRLIHYFDISDTHESRYSRPVPIWEMRPEYEAEETLNISHFSESSILCNQNTSILNLNMLILLISFSLYKVTSRIIDCSIVEVSSGNQHIVSTIQELRCS